MTGLSHASYLDPVPGRVVHVTDLVPGAIYIGRAYPRKSLAASPFANPFRVGHDGDIGTVTAAYRRYLLDSPELLAQLPALRGKPLACWCRHDGDGRAPLRPCHGDVLLETLACFTDNELRALSAPGGAPVPPPDPEPSPQDIDLQIELLRDQVAVTEELVARLHNLNAGFLTNRSLTLGVIHVETGLLWLERAAREVQP